MNSRSLVTVAGYSFPHEAYIASSRLEAEGIPVFVADAHTINMQWLYSNALGGVRVQVPVSYVEQAKAILDQDYSHLLDEVFGVESRVCHSCGSNDVIPYTRGKRSAFIVFLLLGFPLFFYKHGRRCRSCGAFIATK